MEVVVAVAVVLLLLLIISGARRSANANQQGRDVISDICVSAGVPDIPVDLNTYTRAIIRGERKVPLNGYWWVAQGVEQVGVPDKTRMLREWSVPTERDVREIIAAMAAEWGGRALAPPHLNEGFFLGKMPSMPKEVIYARMTGKYRPIGGWVVAVPPEIIAKGRR
jgi:hypothetical protein